MIDGELYSKPFHESMMLSFFHGFSHFQQIHCLGILIPYIESRVHIILFWYLNLQPYLGRGKLFSEGLNAFDGLDGTEMNGCNGIETALLTDNLC